jgi:hypothetical protein
MNDSKHTVELGLEEREEAVPAPPPAKPAGPVKLSEVDRLRAENLFVKGQNIQLQIGHLQKDLQRAQVEGLEVNKKIIALRDEFLKSYGIDLETAQIQDDGTVISSPAPGLPAQVGAMMTHKG